MPKVIEERLNQRLNLFRYNLEHVQTFKVNECFHREYLQIMWMRQFANIESQQVMQKIF